MMIPFFTIVLYFFIPFSIEPPTPSASASHTTQISHFSDAIRGPRAAQKNFFTIFQAFFDDNNKRQPKQVTAPLYVSQFILLFCLLSHRSVVFYYFVSIFYLFVSLAKARQVAQSRQEEAKKILSLFKWLPIFYENAMIRIFHFQAPFRNVFFYCCCFILLPRRNRQSFLAENSSCFTLKIHNMKAPRNAFREFSVLLERHFLQRSSIGFNRKVIFPFSQFVFLLEILIFLFNHSRDTEEWNVFRSTAFSLLISETWETFSVCGVYFLAPKKHRKSLLW